MYNSKVKEEYINNVKQKGDTVEASIRAKFALSCNTEERLNKDLCNFSYGEIIDFYRHLFSGSIATMNANNTYYKNYTAWCMSKGLVEDDQNHYDEITMSVLAACIKGNEENSILTREQLLSIINNTSDEIDNVSNKVLALGLFEGISFSDFFDLYENDFDENNIVTLRETNRKLKVSQLLKDLAYESSHEYRYYSNGEENIKKPYDKTDFRVVKMNTMKIDIDVYKKSLRRRMKRIATYALALNKMHLVESGRIEMIKRFMENNPKSVKQVIYDHKDEIEYRYGVMYSVSRWLEMYEKYFY